MAALFPLHRNQNHIRWAPSTHKKAIFDVPERFGLPYQRTFQSRPSRSLVVNDVLLYKSRSFTWRLMLAGLDPAMAAIGILGPFLSVFSFLFILRIVMTCYPKLPVGKFPYVLAYAPTEPFLIPTRKLIPPLGGLDVTPAAGANNLEACSSWIMATENEIREVEGTDGSGSPPNDPKATQKTVRNKVPEVEIHLYREGKGPIDVFKSRLGGWDQDQLEVREILEKYGLKSIFAFNPSSGRGVPIPFGRNGRSLLGYRDGSVIHVDGAGKDSMIKPVTKILLGTAMIALFLTLVLRETPEWIKRSNPFGGSFPPWILACAVIVFTRMRKRTRDFLKKRGW